MEKKKNENFDKLSIEGHVKWELVFIIALNIEKILLEYILLIRTAIF